MIYSDPVKWPEAQETIRQRMREQPRGYQTLLAEKLGLSRAFVNQVVTGVRPLPLEHLDGILASLNLTYDVALSEFATEAAAPEPETAP